MTPVFIDSTVFVSALGREHPMREPCRALIDRMAIGSLRGETSVEVVQEVVHVRLRLTGDRKLAVSAGRKVADLCHVHGLRPADLDHALSLFEKGRTIGARDALHAAVALAYGLDTIVSADRDFDEVAGLRRIDPLDAKALSALRD